MSVGANVSPDYLIGRNLEQLKKKMQNQSIKRGTYIKYHSIFQMQDGRFVAWFDTENKISLLKSKENKNDLSKE